jgi:hypothetical protein
MDLRGKTRNRLDMLLAKRWSAERSTLLRAVAERLGLLTMLRGVARFRTADYTKWGRVIRITRLLRWAGSATPDL